MVSLAVWTTVASGLLYLWTGDYSRFVGTFLVRRRGLNMVIGLTCLWVWRAVARPLGWAEAAMIVLGVLRTAPTMTRVFPLDWGGLTSRTSLLIDVYMSPLCDRLTWQLMLLGAGPRSEGCRRLVWCSSVALEVVPAILAWAVTLGTWQGLPPIRWLRLWKNCYF